MNHKHPKTDKSPLPLGEGRVRENSVTTYRDGLPKVTLLEWCRALRQTTTDAETLLWKFLRARHVAGAKFRRQHQCGPYILDFFCPEHRLVIEIDGSQHREPDKMMADRARTRYLEARGLRVIRFTNLEVFQETEAVIMRMWEEVERSFPSP
ncbi:MAG: endonuclease domain-containing protein [Chloroflexi bacterium]|nr:endonuclease domain-containing protein [Chloroflexota bacterium]